MTYCWYDCPLFVFLTRLTRRRLVQWSAWMRRTRKDPPTVQELEIDAARQARLKDNVERLRLAYIDEKERLRLETAQVMRRIAEPPSEANAETTTRNAETGPVGLDQVVEQASKKETGQRTSEVGSAGEAEVTGDARLAAQAAQQRQAEREAAKQRREEFGKYRLSPFLSEPELNG